MCIKLYNCKVVNKFNVFVEMGSDVIEIFYKYNGGYNYIEDGEQVVNFSKYMICVDYLLIICIGFIFYSFQEVLKVLNFGDIELKRMGGGIWYYENCYQVKVKGEFFVVLLIIL